MGIVNSVSMAFSEEDPLANQGKSGEEIEDSNEIKEKEEKESKVSLNETKEEIEECNLCKHIKKGVCKESFRALQNCLDENEEEEAGKCKEVRKIFKICMFDNPVYHESIITAQARMDAWMIREVQAGVISELQAEKEAVLAGDSAAIGKSLSKYLRREEPVPAEVAAIAKAFQNLEANKEKIAKGNE